MKMLTPIIAVALLTTQSSWAQTNSRNELSEAARARCAALSARWESCDKLKAEGDYLECNRQILAAYEMEITRLTAEIRATLPKSQLKSFDAAANKWHQYFIAEKVHLKQLNNHLGSVSWIGLHAGLVGIAKARCDYLSGQFL